MLSTTVSLSTATGLLYNQNMASDGTGGRITAIEKQKNRKIYDIHIDGEAAFTLNNAVLAEMSIHIGDTVKAETLDEQIHAVENKYAFDKALGYLTGGMRTTSQVRDYLKRKGFHPGSIQEALEKLEQYGYLNDAHFAQSFVESRQSKKGVSRRQLANALHRRGLGSEDVEDAVSAISDDEEIHNAIEFARKYIKSHQGQAGTLRKKAGRALFAKGFASQTISTALKTVFCDTDEEGVNIDEG
ncbi:MAG: RecX family transcriptional regulator [Bacillota bacterium]|nr:RecX family transcriptional regulator [Bacillota bacterium]